MKVRFVKKNEQARITWSFDVWPQFAANKLSFIHVHQKPPNALIRLVSQSKDKNTNCNLPRDDLVSEKAFKHSVTRLA